LRNWRSGGPSPTLCARLGHTRLETTQIYTTIRPPQLKQAVEFYDDHAERLLALGA
jgi:hypothetical protein